MGLGLIAVIFVVGLGPIFCELFVPGGILGTIGALCVLGSIVLAFQHSGPLSGSLFLILAIAVIPAIVWYALKRITFKGRMSKEAGFTSSKAGMEELVGKEGVAGSTLRPAGTATVDGKRVDVVTAGEVVDKGTRIRVKEVSGNRVVVRAVKQ